MRASVGSRQLLITMVFVCGVACSGEPEPSQPSTRDMTAEMGKTTDMLFPDAMMEDMDRKAPDMHDASMSDLTDIGPLDMSMDMTVALDLGRDMPPEPVDMAPEMDPRDGPGTFVAVGWRETLVSFDEQGQLLSERHLDQEEQYNKSLLLRTVTWGPRGFVAMGDKLIYWSLDGQSWMASEKPMGSGWMSGVVFAQGRYVGAGGTGAMWSDDGRVWQATQVMRGVAIRDMTYGNGVFVAVGDAGFRAVSTDGESWTVTHPPDEETPGLNGIAYGAGKFVAVGGAGLRMTSADGMTWQNEVEWDEPERTMSVESRLSLADAVYAQGQWVVVGRKYLYTSPDATAGSWQKHDTNTYFTSVTYGGGQFVATAGRDVWGSPDGVAWSKFVMPAGSNYWDVAFMPDPL